MSGRSRDQVVREVFTRAASVAAWERREILDHACADDPGLREEVESLLEHHRAEDGFLEAGAVRDAGVCPPAEPPDTLAAGTRIGAYTIRRTLGMGGMGVVYEAEQSSPRRLVALKVTRGGLASAEMSRRFKREAAVLALLTHPNIAQIFEAGFDATVPGQPAFLVMELVQGRPLIEYTRERERSLTQKLGLFTQVCAAVTHAHQRGVIHRDLKPANILVEEGDRVKVLDFGIARLVEGPSGATRATSHGLVLGTLAYMSPEQAAGDPASLDVRTDVYSLGVVLYELLTGQTPIDVSACATPEAVRRIAVLEPPTLGRIDRTLRGELSVIVARALEKDRSRRYQSAAALGEDVRRFLAGEPILARQDSSLYVLRKQLGRHRKAVTAGLLALAGLVYFSAHTTVQSWRERDLRKAAEASLATARTERARADRSATEMASQLSVSNVFRGRWLIGQGDFQAAERLLWSVHLKQPESVHSLWALRELYRTYRSRLAVRIGREHNRALSVSPDGKLAATGTLGGDVVFVDLRNGRITGAIASGGAAVTGADFSPDGSRCVTLSDSGVARVWCLTADGSPSLSLQVQAHSGADDATVGHAAAYDPRGRWFATSGRDGAMRLFDAFTAESLREFTPGLSVRYQAIAFDPSGSRLVCLGENGLVYIADLDGIGSSLRSLATPSGGRSGSLAAVTFACDGTRVVAGAVDGAHLWFEWDTESGALLSRNPTHGTSVRSAVVRETDQQMVTTGYWGVDVWDLPTRTTAPDVFVRGSTYAAEFVPGTDRIVTTLADRSLRVWETSPVGPRALSAPGSGGVLRTSCTPDGSKMLLVCRDGTTHLCDPLTWRTTPTMGGAQSFPARVGAISPDGRTAAAAATGRVRVWSLETGRILAEFEDLTGAPVDVVFTGDSRRLVGADRAGRVVLWDLPTASTVGVLAAEGPEAFRLAISPDGYTVAVAQRVAIIPMWDTRTGKPVADLPLPSGAWSFDFDPSGQRLAWGSWAGNVHMLDLNSRRELLQFDAHTQYVREVRFSPDGRVLATASGDGKVKLWEAASGLPLHEFAAPAASGGDVGEVMPTSVTFGPTGAALHITYAGGRIHVWDLAEADGAIAGHVEYMLAEISPGDPSVDVGPVRAWAARLRHGGHRWGRGSSGKTDALEKHDD